MKSSTIKLTLLTAMVLLISAAIIITGKNPVFSLDVFESSTINAFFNHQIFMGIMALIVLIVIWLMAKDTRLTYLNVRRIDGPIKPEPWIGLKPTGKDSWKSLGITFSVIITSVTAIIIYFQVMQGGTFQFEWYPLGVMVIIFALTNSFIEETIFRLSFVTVVANEKLKPEVAQILAAITFGLVHYFGTPSGIPGVLMAGFIGWFLAKSMNETKGFFWAWLIHFLQDVVIIFALFSYSIN